MPSPGREGLTEYVIVLALLTLAAAGAVAIFGDEIRGLFGAPKAARARAHAGPPGPAGSPSPSPTPGGR